MIQPDIRLFRPIMVLRYIIIMIMVVAYTIAWALIPESITFAVMSGILAADAILSGVLYFALVHRYKGLLVHLSLLIDTLATTGLILCTGSATSLFQLFYVLIVVAAGLLYGEKIGTYYLLTISLGNLAALAVDNADPLQRNRSVWAESPYNLILAVAVPLVAFLMLQVVRLTQRGLYLQALYENVSDGLLVLDDSGRVVDANGRAAQMAGRERHELIGMPLESLAASGGTDSAAVVQQFLRCLAGEIVSFEIELDRKQQAPLPVEISAQHVTGLSPGRIQAFARDISARRLMEAEIRRQNEELRRINQELQVGRDLALNASRMKSQFLANMSHELRTPLNSIIGYTQFVLEDPDRPLPVDQQEDLRRVLHAARHLLELINGVLDLARIESGRESVTTTRFRLDDLVDSVLDAISPLAKGKGLELECVMRPGIPELQTDDKKLRQVLLNLLANAVKFTERGTVWIECSPRPEGELEIVVRDTGIGIPPEHLEEIFNEFHQVDPTIHKHYGGSGLGLAIVKRLVELLKGEIEVESVVQSGSVFTVMIPCSLSMAREDVAEGSAAWSPTPDSAQRGKRWPDNFSPAMVDR